MYLRRNLLVVCRATAYLMGQRRGAFKVQNRLVRARTFVHDVAGPLEPKNGESHTRTLETAPVVECQCVVVAY